MPNKISVITVVYNDVEHIRNTMDSFFAQTWEDKEYIVIDGGSTDGTENIIKEYSDRLAYWCSEKDDGLYDAMNKGISHCSGEWINILNSGDTFYSENTIKDVFNQITDNNSVDVIFGDSIAIHNNYEEYMPSDPDITKLDYMPTFRHGSSFIKASLNKDNLYAVKKKDLGYSLDWYLLHTLFVNGAKFKRVPLTIQKYLADGISNHVIKNLWYNHKITSLSGRKLKKIYVLFKLIAISLFKQSIFYKIARDFILFYIPNDVLPHILPWSIRKCYLRHIGMTIGDRSFISKNNYFINANRVNIGNSSHINRNCTIDARAGVNIGNNVSISHNVCIITGSHDIQSKNFVGLFRPIVIEDYVWIGVNATILQGVTIGKGAVVCAGAIVVKDVEPYNVVAGIPAKTITKRNDELDYECISEVYFN